ncbi:LOW QUALITY PROTEIN: hypothetical protein M8C21_002691 [Ambrosia artemisiifolia]|uniref:Uncharacterized protein n=1 Tax=Ambrosia artemisiifolia TaxID=4212 RepID=A0AAD5DAU4_AMBAR|nr:LOW QUALITY PROTEIN: hypothetical protein M8C21_002691 [Ambrosia artemisiifolia]
MVTPGSMGVLVRTLFIVLFCLMLHLFTYSLLVASFLVSTLMPGGSYK